MSLMLNYMDDYLDAGMRGWIVTTALRNFKRIDTFTRDDLIQEGYFCFFKCKSKYVGIEGLRKKDGTPCRFLPVKDPDQQSRKHFQSLVMRTFGNRISDLALKQPRGWEVPISTVAKVDETIEQAWEDILPADNEVATVGALLANAPNEIKQLFDLLIRDAVQGYRRFGKHRHAPRETTNQLFCRYLGLKRGTDIVGQVERHFLGT